MIHVNKMANKKKKGLEINYVHRWRGRGAVPHQQPKAPALRVLERRAGSCGCKPIPAKDPGVLALTNALRTCVYVCLDLTEKSKNRSGTTKIGGAGKPSQPSFTCAHRSKERTACMQQNKRRHQRARGRQSHQSTGSTSFFRSLKQYAPAEKQRQKPSRPCWRRCHLERPPPCRDHDHLQ